jgi:hypothetical protein
MLIRISVLLLRLGSEAVNHDGDAERSRKERTKHNRSKHDFLLKELPSLALSHLC